MNENTHVLSVTKEVYPDLLNEQLDAAYGLEDWIWLHQQDKGLILLVPDNLDPEIAQSVLDAHDPVQETGKNKHRSRVLAFAESVVGKPLDKLSDKQVQALMICLLQRAGAVADDMTIRPFSEWL